MDMAQIISTFGAWGVVVCALIWEAKFVQDQLEKSRQDRNEESVRHANEVSNLAEVIKNNTIAITELTAYIKQEDDI